jgi:hypothetical protein
MWFCSNNNRPGKKSAPRVADLLLRRSWRLLLVCAGLLLFLPACSRFHKKAASVPPRTATTTATNQTSLIVAPSASGKVAFVNKQAGHVVLIFPIGQVPPLNTRMVVYHNEAKVGEVKVSGPTQENLTVADIVLGSVAENDEVRSE